MGLAGLATHGHIYYAIDEWSGIFYVVLPIYFAFFPYVSITYAGGISSAKDYKKARTPELKKLARYDFIFCLYSNNALLFIILPL